MLVFVNVYVFRGHSWCIHQWELNHWGLHHCGPSEHTHGRHMCILVMVIGLHQECTKWLLPPLLQVGGAFYSVSCPPGTYSFGAQQSPNPSSFPTWWGVFFSRFDSTWWRSNLESLVHMKPSESGVVIGYQVDELTHICLQIVCFSFTHLPWVHR